MRVIAGSARGKKLIAEEGLDVRPTLDRVKESVFNMIAFDVTEATVLDLFSGSGALGIEALSRGAKHCTFVDMRRSALTVTEKNLTETRLKNASTIVCSDSIRFLKETDKTFDIIFIDPPYATTLYEEALFLIANRNLLNPEGIIVLEYDEKTTPPFSLCGFSIYRDKKYGRVKIYLMKA